MSFPDFKIVYLYDTNGVYIGEYNAQHSPLDEPGTYLLPELCLEQAPTFVDGTWPVAKDGGWVNEADYRGQVFYDAAGTAVIIDALGEVPAGLLASPPPPTLEEVRAKQSGALNSLCQSEITSGAVSMALGASYTYPTEITGQQNLAANVLSSLFPGLPSDWTTLQMCKNTDGDWGYVAHTAPQIQQVGSDVKSVISALLVRNSVAQKNVQIAALVTEIEAVIL